MPDLMPRTHYVAAFTKARGCGQHTQQRAVCGAWINPLADHDVEPTCPTCRAWCEQNTAEAEALADQWAREEMRTR